MCDARKLLDAEPSFGQTLGSPSRQLQRLPLTLHVPRRFISRVTRRIRSLSRPLNSTSTTSSPVRSSGSCGRVPDFVQHSRHRLRPRDDFRYVSRAEVRSDSRTDSRPRGSCSLCRNNCLTVLRVCPKLKSGLSAHSSLRQLVNPQRMKRTNSLA